MQTTQPEPAQPPDPLPEGNAVAVAGTAVPVPSVPVPAAGRAPGGVLPLLAAGVTIVLWASAFVAIRHVGAQIAAGPLTLGRLLVGTVALGAVILLRSRRDSLRSGWPAGSTWVRVVICGVLWFGVYNVALNEAERHLDAGTAALLVNIGPILIAVLSAILLGEGFTRPFIAGAGIAFAGVVVIAASSSAHRQADVWGVVLCLVSAITYAVAVVVQKPILVKTSALRVTWLACTVGAICCLPFLPVLIHELSGASTQSVWLIVYLGAFPTAIAFTTWAYALARMPAGRLGISTYLVPPIAILMGWALLGETPAGLAYVGGALCLAGVALSRRKSFRKAR